MSMDIKLDDMLPNQMPITKVTSKIGDGEGTRFAVNHPMAPNVVCALYRSVGGEEVSLHPHHGNGVVVYGFNQPPAEDEFIAVVIG